MITVVANVCLCETTVSCNQIITTVAKEEHAVIKVVRWPQVVGGEGASAVCGGALGHICN